MVELVQGDEVVHVTATAASNYSQHVWRHWSFLVCCLTVLWRVCRKWRQLLLSHLREAEFVRVLVVRRVQNALSLPSSWSELLVVDGEWGWTCHLLDVGPDGLLVMCSGSHKGTSQSRAHVPVSVAAHVLQNRREGGPTNRLARLTSSRSFTGVHLMARSLDLP